VQLCCSTDIAMVGVIFIVILLICPNIDAGFKKCCPAGQILDLHTKKCVPGISENTEGFVATVFDLYTQNKTLEEITFENIPLEELNLCNQSQRYLFSSFNVIRKGEKLAIYDTRRKKYVTKVCIDDALDTKTFKRPLVAQSCLDCSPEVPCANLCCPSGHVNRNGTCVKDDVNFTNILTGMAIKEVNLVLHCKRPTLYPKKFWNFTSQGEMEVDGIIRNASEYCIQIKNETEANLLLCPMNDPADKNKTFKLICLCLSIPSILLIILFHVLIDDLRTLHITKLKIPFYVSLLLSFVVILVTNLKDFTGTSSCVFWALLLQYFSLAIFFWLTSISLDIWLAFRIIANPAQNKPKKEAILKSRIKCFYVLSFGCPLIISLVTATLQFISNKEESSYIHPSIGVSCMLGQYQPQFLYFHLIIIVLLCLNGLFYCLMLFKFTCGIWKEDSFPKAQMRNFRVFIELFFLMGINWISESVVFFVGWTDKDDWDHPLLVLLSSINWLIGVFIFLLFCSKSMNRNLVRNLLFGQRDEPDYYNLARTFSTQLSDKEETFRVIETIIKKK